MNLDNSVFYRLDKFLSFDTCNEIWDTRGWKSKASRTEGGSGRMDFKKFMPNTWLKQGEDDKNVSFIVRFYDTDILEIFKDNSIKILAIAKYSSNRRTSKTTIKRIQALAGVSLIWGEDGYYIHLGAKFPSHVSVSSKDRNRLQYENGLIIYPHHRRALQDRNVTGLARLPGIVTESELRGDKVNPLSPTRAIRGMVELLIMYCANFYEDFKNSPKYSYPRKNPIYTFDCMPDNFDRVAMDACTKTTGILRPNGLDIVLSKPTLGAVYTGSVEGKETIWEIKPKFKDAFFSFDPKSKHFLGEKTVKKLRQMTKPLYSTIRDGLADYVCKLKSVDLSNSYQVADLVQDKFSTESISAKDLENINSLRASFLSNNPGFRKNNLRQSDSSIRQSFQQRFFWWSVPAVIPHKSTYVFRDDVLYECIFSLGANRSILARKAKELYSCHIGILFEVLLGGLFYSDIRPSWAEGSPNSKKEKGFGVLFDTSLLTLAVEYCSRAKCIDKEFLHRKVFKEKSKSWVLKVLMSYLVLFDRLFFTPLVENSVFEHPRLKAKLENFQSTDRQPLYSQYILS
jgi:hypothetical protein